MANDQLVVSDDRDLFLEYLLRSALTAPNAAVSPTAGRILARLLVVAAIEGGDLLVTPYLVPAPGEQATFEVRAYRAGNLTPTDVRGGLGAAAALKVALRVARDGTDGIEVVSRAQSGLERCVLVRDSTGDFEFRFANGETLTGHPSECAAARRAWAATLASWRAWVNREHPASDEPAPLADSPVVPSRDGIDTGRRGDLQSDVRSFKKANRGWWASRREEGSHEGAGRRDGWDQDPHERYRPAAEQVTHQLADHPAPDPEPDAHDRPATTAPERDAHDRPATTDRERADEDLATSGWAPTPPWRQAAPAADPEASAAPDPDPQARADPPPDPEASAAPDPAADPGASAALASSPADPEQAGPPVPAPDRDQASPTAGAPDPPAAGPLHAALSTASRPFRPVVGAETVIGAVQQALDNLTVDVDLSQVESLIRRALDGDRQELVEPLARRLSIRLGESLDLPNTRDFVQTVLPLIPRADDVAEAVAAEIAELLSETVLRRRPGDAGASGDTPGILAAMENLQVQLDGLRDQVRKSSDVLNAIGDRMEANDRRAAVAERLTTSIDHEMHRLANRIDEQVSELATHAGGGSELADGVARLTRKLRQSVDQLDRALVRLDQMVDQAGLDQAGLDQAGLDRGGLDRGGLDKGGLDPEHDQDALEPPGIHRQGFTPRQAVRPRSLSDSELADSPRWMGGR